MFVTKKTFCFVYVGPLRRSRFVKTCTCCVWLVFAVVQSHIQLLGQSLQGENLGYLHGGDINPQDRVLGLLYISEWASSNGEEIFELVEGFWNRINVGNLDESLLSSDGKALVAEQVAPFIERTPLYYREARKKPSGQFGTKAESGSAEKQLLPPLDKLRLSRVRMTQPIIDGDYARLHCRLEINENSAFVLVQMFFLKEGDSWKIDALDLNWNTIVPVEEETAINVFGRKQELLLLQ